MTPLLVGWLAGCNDFALEEVKETVPDGMRALTVSPGEVDFGVRPDFTAVAQTVTVTSVGDLPVTVSAVDVSGSSAFQITWAQAETALAPGEALDVLVTYTPQSPEDLASLTVRSDGVDPATTVPLLGAATVPAIRIDPTSLSFRSEAGESVTLSAEVQSVGTADLSISGTVLEGDPFTAVFSTPVVLPPGSSAPVEVTYTPGAEGETVTGSLWFATNTPAGYALLPLDAVQAPSCIGLGEAWDRGLLDPHTDGGGLNLVVENLSTEETVCIDQWYVFRAVDSQDLGAGDMAFDLGGTYPAGSLSIAPGGSLTFLAASLPNASWWCLELEQHTNRNKPYTFTGARVFDPVLGDMVGADQEAIWDWQEAHPLLMAARGTNYVEVPSSGGTAPITLRPFNMGSVHGYGELFETIPAGWNAHDFSVSPTRETTNSDGSTTYVFDLDLRGRVHTGSSSEDTWYDEIQIDYTLDVLPCVGRQLLPVMRTEWTDEDGILRTDTSNPLVVNCTG